MTWTIRRRSDACPLAAIARGDGPLVLLLHGVGLRAEAWNAQIDVLARTHRVLAVDLPGHGESPALGADVKLRDFTHAIVAAVGAPTVVIGHSFGAMIALDMAVRYPEQIKAVAALNAIYRRDPAAQVAVQARADMLDDQTPVDPTVPLVRWFGEHRSPARTACHLWLSNMDPAAYRSAYRAFAYGDAPSDVDLRNLHCPALFLTGEMEPNSTPQMSHQMAALVPHARSTVIAQAAHMMPMTHAAQVNAALIGVLQGGQ